VEKLLWGSWSPAKVKLGVSGCPRNCAEATCKDIGVVCVDSGYEISVAGAAGMEVKETELLCKVASEAEAIEIIAAFVQLYRENARYLHRIYKWVALVGLDWCRQQVVEDPANRRALYDRFMVSQSVYQKDPWAEHARPEQRAEWRPLADLTLEAAE
jgi:nitrite reductase (NADH) large subunit